MEHHSFTVEGLDDTLPQVALSVRQPWAWAIITLGKDIENRTWSTKYRGPVLIHAGKGVKQADVDAFLATVEEHPDLAGRLAAAGGLNLDALGHQAGGIVGVAEIADCLTASPSPWFFGPYGFELRRARPLPFLPCRGALGFFDPRKVGQPKAAKSERPPTPPSPQADLFG